ncbi:hypothetical protein JCM10003_1921 [Bacteroides pyogenes JCM 10003]|nr:hypothetical protein JCM10003_1921 [Bacteroides pyogenes JCM 10003]
MSFLLCLKRPFIWLSRFRHRCGYGVHSPFAFGLITDVVYERRPYYAYANLESEEKERRRKEGRIKGHVKVNRLLFRLVNRIQPGTIVEVGPLSVASLYMQLPESLPVMFLPRISRSLCSLPIRKLIFCI